MARPWMPLYIADYLADTAHLNAAEHGAYLLLIMHYWRTGGLPEDEAQLMRIARMTARQWSQSRDLLRSFFGDDWCHKRIDIELAQAIEISERRSASAHEMHDKRRANALQVQTHSPSQSHKEEKKETRAPRARSPKGFLSDDWLPSNSNLTLEGKEEFEKMRDWAKSNAIQKADWGATWRNWMRRAGGVLEEPDPATPQKNGAAGIYMNFSERERWDEYGRQIGKTYPKDSKGGWWFPTKEPPEDKCSV